MQTIAEAVPANPATGKRRLLVLGATGGTGRLIVAEALRRGDDVAILVRSPEKAKGLEGATLIVGDARDEAVLRAAVKGRDAVISTLGTQPRPFGAVTLFSSTTRVLVAATEAERVPRLVVITGIGAGDSKGHGGLLFDWLLLPLVLRSIYDDKTRQEAIIRASTLDWVVVRPVILNDRPARGTVRAMTDLSRFHGGSIARADVAAFVLDQVTGNDWLRQTPLISW